MVGRESERERAAATSHIRSTAHLLPTPASMQLCLCPSLDSLGTLSHTLATLSALCSAEDRGSGSANQVWISSKANHQQPGVNCLPRFRPQLISLER